MTDVERHSGNGADSATSNRVDTTYSRLLDLIVHGHIAPGSRIIESEVADRLGVSRTPVGAAFQRLVQEGLIEENGGNGSRPRRRISPLTGENARELIYLLGSLEGLAARRVADSENGGRRQVVAELQTLNDRLENVAETQPRAPSSFLEIDTEFHRALVVGSGGPRLLKLHESWRPQAERYFRHYLVNRQYPLNHALEEHDEMIEAISSGDPDVAEDVAKKNWRNAEERLQRAIDRAGERGIW